MGGRRDYCVCMEICSGVNPFQVYGKILDQLISQIYTQICTDWLSCTCSCDLFLSTHILRLLSWSGCDIYVLLSLDKTHRNLRPQDQPDSVR